MWFHGKRHQAFVNLWPVVVTIVSPTPLQKLQFALPIFSRNNNLKSSGKRNFENVNLQDGRKDHHP